MKRLFHRAAVSVLLLIAVHGRAQVPPDIEAGLQTIGHVIAPPPTYKLYTPLFNGKNLMANGVKVTRDVASGSDQLQKLDIFEPEGSEHTIVVFVHGGNFQRGDKLVSNTPFFDNVSGFLAAHGMLGVTINYRLAPPVSYPAEHQDIAATVVWLRAHAEEYGGDSTKIVLWGESSGAALIAGYLAHAEFHPAGGHGVRAAVLTSGGYDAVPGPYFGDDPAQLEQRSVWNGSDKVSIPLFVSHTELDPSDFAAQADSGSQLPALSETANAKP
jgi:triacylglycerol lipase